ncbi:MAG: alpha-glucosidase C-terminal domain-containing protein [Bacteroidales bacterium]|nr:alpha-glucosidase C-terminal domain-containing protein [Bacteroidales bacterium]
MKRLLFIMLTASVVACSPKRTPIPETGFIPGIAMPVRLDKGQPEIILADLAPEVSIIDSVSLYGRILKFSGDKQVAAINVGTDAPPLMELKIWSGGQALSVPVMKSRKTDILYSFDPGNSVYEKVELAGEFNGWTPSRTPLKFENGNWVTTLSLNPGRYQYQLVTDGKWKIDPANPDSVDNNNGGFNSVLKAGPSDRSAQPQLFASGYDLKCNEIGITWTSKPDEFLVFWQNVRLDETYLEQEEDELNIFIPEEAKRFGRSFIRVFAYNVYGLSNDLLIPLQNGKVVLDPADLTRADRQSMIIYNVFTDRFFNGNPSNDKRVGNPQVVLPKADYFGGDIAGVTQKIREGYFNDLGVNTLWISPVVLNPDGAYGQWNDPKTKFSAYHGYWPVSFTLIDPRMGTPEEFREMVSEAHARGINVLLDFVAHHVHELHPYYIEHPSWTTSLYLPDGSLNTEKWDEHRLTTWFDVFLPTLDLQQPEVTEMLSDSAVWWIKHYNLDGFRHDATKHVPEIFWRTLTRKLKQQVLMEEGREVYQIGETYGGPELIASYIGSGMLDGQFDFNVYDAAIGVFARESDPFTNLDKTLQTSLDFYGYNNQMGYITGNQDRGRFISYAGGDLKFGENAKAAGWTREIGVGDTIGYRRLSMLTAFNMTIPGLPVIYYGDETGIPGGNDPDSRRQMKFSDLTPLEMRTKNLATELARIRKDNLALVYGSFSTVEVSDKIYVFVRKYFDNEVIVIFNKNNRLERIEADLPHWMDCKNMKAMFGHDFKINERKLSVEIQPWSFEIIVNTRP